MLEANPTNKHMLAKAQGLKFLLHLAHQSDEAVAPYYFRLIALLGMYDILYMGGSIKELQYHNTPQENCFDISQILVLLRCVYYLISRACHLAT